MLLSLLVLILVVPMMFWQVLSDVLLKSIEGERVLYDGVDLDYWTIRQWRKLYLLLLDYQSKFPFHYYKLEIRPKQIAF